MGGIGDNEISLSTCRSTVNGDLGCVYTRYNRGRKPAFSLVGHGEGHRGLVDVALDERCAIECLIAFGTARDGFPAGRAIDGLRFEKTPVESRAETGVAVVWKNEARDRGWRKTQSSREVDTQQRLRGRRRFGDEFDTV